MGWDVRSFEIPVSIAKFMMTVATAPASTDADSVKAGEWPHFGWHMVWTLYAIESKMWMSRNW